jgi:hypothetical protein
MMRVGGNGLPRSITGLSKQSEGESIVVLIALGCFIVVCCWYYYLLYLTLLVHFCRSLAFGVFVTGSGVGWIVVVASGLWVLLTGSLVEAPVLYIAPAGKTR